MADVMIERMALDLGIKAYQNESAKEFAYRVSYSAMSSWIKTIALDEPVGSVEGGFSGVSRRHVFERSQAVLNMLCKILPELGGWYAMKEGEEQSVLLIRNRLLNRGDLINAGFETAITLSKPYIKPLTRRIEAVYGRILEDGLCYNGIASVRSNSVEPTSRVIAPSVRWMEDFIKAAWWSATVPDTSRWQYYNPQYKNKNHYLAWQDDVPGTVNGVVLARSIVNANSYEYYLLKPADMLIHRLDPFLQEQGEQIRVMYALRACCGNGIEAVLRHYSDHYCLKLNARLPAQERTLFESYCWPVKHVKDELNWCMNEYIWEYLNPFVDALGIKILEETDG